MVTRPKPSIADIQSLRKHTGCGLVEARRTLLTSWCRKEITDIAKESPRTAEVLLTMLDMMRMS